MAMGLKTWVFVTCAVLASVAPAASQTPRSATLRESNGIRLSVDQCRLNTREVSFQLSITNLTQDRLYMTLVGLGSDVAPSTGRGGILQFRSVAGVSRCSDTASQCTQSNDVRDHNRLTYIDPHGGTAFVAEFTGNDVLTPADTVNVPVAFVVRAVRGAEGLPPSAPEPLPGPPRVVRFSFPTLPLAACQ